MSILEIALVIAGITTPFLMNMKKFNRKMGLLVILSLILLHFFLDGLRWQMATIYLLSLMNIVMLLTKASYFDGHWIKKIFTFLFIFFTSVLGLALSLILPVFDLPELTGSFAVGSQYIHFISEQEETISEEVGDKRELMIKVWYPAEIKDEKRELFLDQGERQGFAAKYGLPKRTFNYLDKVKTNTYSNPSAASGRFPVLVFSHGYNSNATGYYALLEEIVSHGYIVLNINHTYESMGALFPSGKIKFYDRDYDAKHNTGEMAEMIWQSMEEFNKASNLAERTLAIKETLKNYVAADITERWSKDINEVISEISNWEKSTFLRSHIDEGSVGVFGHSQGGAAAAQTLLDNSSILAGASVDGAQWGEMVDTFLSKPFLHLSSNWPAEHPDFNEVAFQNGSTSDFYKALLKDSGHSSFMDIPFILRASFLNQSGQIDREKGIKASSRLLLNFFDKYLKKVEVDLLDKSQYPEIEVNKFK